MPARCLPAREYEVHVRTFVDNTSAPTELRMVAYGSYGDIRTVTVL